MITKNSNEQLQLENWLSTYDWTAFGTLKFTDGFCITEKNATDTIMRFFNSLDKIYLGSNLIAKNYRIGRVVFAHKGTSGQNLHYHFLALPPACPSLFCETAKCLWAELSTFTMGYEHQHIEIIQSVSRAASYCLHEYPHLNSDTLFLPATHLPSQLPTRRPIHQLRRLVKRHKQNEALIESAHMRLALRKTYT